VTSLKGHLGEFEVSWEQDNPIDLEVCTRCNACIHACPEQAIDFSYQIDMDKCKAHRECVKACGAIRAIDFERAERARSERFDMVLDLSAQPLIKTAQLPQGYLAPGADPLEQALAAGQLGQMVGEFESRASSPITRRSARTAAPRRSAATSAWMSARPAPSRRTETTSRSTRTCAWDAAVARPSALGAMSYAYPERRTSARG